VLGELKNMSLDDDKAPSERMHSLAPEEAEETEEYSTFLENVKNAGAELASYVTGYWSQGPDTIFGTFSTTDADETEGLLKQFLSGEPKKGGDKPIRGDIEEKYKTNRRTVIQILGGGAAAGAGINSMLEDEGNGQTPPAGNETDPTPTPRPTDQPTETPEPTETPYEENTPTPTPEPRGEVMVVGEEGDLVRIEATEGFAIYDDQSELPTLDGREICYPGKGEIVATYDASDIEGIVGDLAEDLTPYKGTLALDIDQVDASVSGSGFDEEPEYIFQVVGQDEQVYLKQDEMEEITGLDFYEYNC
jgi:hypothetical protein